MGQVMLSLMSSIGWSFGKLTEQEKVIAPAREAGVREIAKGNLEKKPDIRTGDEIENLAESVYGGHE